MSLLLLQTAWPYSQLRMKLLSHTNVHNAVSAFGTPCGRERLTHQNSTLEQSLQCTLSKNSRFCFSGSLGFHSCCKTSRILCKCCFLLCLIYFTANEGAPDGYPFPQRVMSILKPFPCLTKTFPLCCFKCDIFL